ncbi:MAG: HD domain-containing protein [Ruminococcaceae bacterium]|nr:HD domain-containing protein [Oscillospiraceae bacterium]
MNHIDFITFLNKIEKLKCTLRHSWTSSGRQESVAEHSWRLAVMAMLCNDEYPDIDIDKVIKMSLIHDFGEAITGDIPAFLKTNHDETKENEAVKYLISELPCGFRDELSSLFDEMNAMQTHEAKLFKALDNMEALISHNEAPLSTWLENEYTDNLTYGQENVLWSAWTTQLKEAIKEVSIRKITAETSQT